MADATYTPLVYNAQGGSQLVVASGGSIKMETGSAIVPNSGTQASAVAAITATGTFSTTICAKIEAIRAACAGAGVLATS